MKKFLTTNSVNKNYTIIKSTDDFVNYEDVYTTQIPAEGSNIHIKNLIEFKGRIIYYNVDENKIYKTGLNFDYSNSELLFENVELNENNNSFFKVKNNYCFCFPVKKCIDKNWNIYDLPDFGYIKDIFFYNNRVILAASTGLYRTVDNYENFLDASSYIKFDNVNIWFGLIKGDFLITCRKDSNYRLTTIDSFNLISFTWVESFNLYGSTYQHNFASNIFTMENDEYIYVSFVETSNRYLSLSRFKISTDGNFSDKTQLRKNIAFTNTQKYASFWERYQTISPFSFDDIYMWNSDNVLIQKVNISSFSQTGSYSVEDAYPLSIYKEYEGNISFSGEGSYELNGLLFGDDNHRRLNFDENFSIKINIDTSTTIVSKVETLTGVYDPETLTINYPSEDYYINDTVVIETKIANPVKSNAYRIPSRITVEGWSSFTSNVENGYWLSYNSSSNNYEYVKLISIEYDSSNELLRLNYDNRRTEFHAFNNIINFTPFGEGDGSRFFVFETDFNEASHELYNLFNSEETEKYELNQISHNVKISLTHDDHSSFRIENTDHYYNLINNELFIWDSFKIFTSFEDGYRLKELTSTYGQILNDYIVIDKIPNHETDYINVLSETSDFSIILYNNVSENNKLEKTLINEYSTKGNLRENCSIQSPIITFNLSKVPNYNYAYIEEFKRYYFITNIENVGWNLWRFSMSIDVLMSFKDNIKNLNAFVTRNEFEYDPLVRDDLVSYEYDKNIIEYKPENGSKVNTTFDSESLSIASNNVSISVINDEMVPVVPQQSYSEEPPSNILPNVPNFVTGTGLGSITYATYYRSIQQLYKRLIKNDILSSYVLSIVLFPFTIPTQSTPGEILYLSLGETKLEPTSENSGDGIVVSELEKQMPNYLTIADFTINGNSFLDYEPYSQYDIYLPYLGWINLSADIILNKRLLIIYVVDYSTGNSQVSIIDDTSKKVVFTSSAQLGVSIPINTTNAREVENNRLTNNIGLGIGIASSAITTVAGIATQNPLMVAGGIMGSAKSISSYISNNNNNYEKASGTVGSGSVGVYLPQHVRIRKTSLKPKNYDENYFSLHGRPLNEFKKIGDLNGFTKIGEMHIEDIPNATKNENDIIYSKLIDGIIL